MSVRSVPVADKLEQQNVQETLSEGRLGTQEEVPELKYHLI